MRRARSFLVLLLAPAALAGCPSKPSPASLLEIDGSVPPDDSSADASTGNPDGMTPIDGPSVIELGFPDPFPGTRTLGSNDLVGFPIHVTTSLTGEILSWGVRAPPGQTGIDVRMALYSDSGTDQPAMLLAQSGTWSLANGMQPTAPPRYWLSTGNYWLLISVSGTASIGRSTVSPAEGTECFRQLMFTTPFPSSWGGSSCFGANPINVFIQVKPP